MTELSSVRELAAAHKKRLHETMGNMMKELNESGAGNVSDEDKRDCEDIQLLIMI